MIVVGDQLLMLHSHALAASSFGAVVRVAIVGLGVQGQLLLKTFLKIPGVELAALCDVDEMAVKKAGSFFDGKKRVPQVFSDIRRVLDLKTIDAVVIATPNHWHSLMGIWTCQSGKHCYVESPCSHSFNEGRELVAAARHYKRVVQSGSLGHLSDLSGFDPVGIACLGSIRSSRTTVYASGKFNTRRQPRFSSSRSYDLWVGPATVPGTAEEGLHWRELSSMHNGCLGSFVLGDLHRNIQLMGSNLPTRVSTLTSAEMETTEQSNIAVHMNFEDENDAGSSKSLAIELLPMSRMPRDMVQAVAVENASKKSARVSSVPQVVAETTLRGTGGTLTAITTPNQERESEFLAHNFVAAVREGKQQLLISPIEEAHVSCGSLHLANISLALRRSIQFDPASQSAPNDAPVNELLSGSHRPPYSLPRRA
jgi:hypothetical protein